MGRRTTVAAGTAAALTLMLASGCTTDGGAPPAPSTAAVPPSIVAPAASTVAPTSSTPTTTASTPAAPPESIPQRVAPSTAAGVDASAGVDRTDPDAVTTAALTAFFTADTTVDEGPNDAAARAGALLTPAYAATILGSPPLIGAGAQWDSWATRGVRLTVALSSLPDDRPADTATTAFRIDLVTQTPTTAAGQNLAPVVVVAYVAMTATPAGWAVAGIEQR